MMKLNLHALYSDLTVVYTLFHTRLYVIGSLYTDRDQYIKLLFSVGILLGGDRNPVTLCELVTLVTSYLETAFYNKLLKKR